MGLPTLLKIICIATMLIANSELISAQRITDRPVRSPLYVTDGDQSPRMRIDAATSTRFKIAARKTLFRFGDIINLDLAVLNVAKSPIYFHKLAGPTITMTVNDDKGDEVAVIPTAAVLEAMVPSSFMLLGPGEVMLGSFQLFIGCDSPEMMQFEQARQEFNVDVQLGHTTYEEGLFDRNLFINWGDACLKTRHAGKYTLIIKVRNRHVIVSPEHPHVKTAVGTVQSTPFQIEIVD